MKTYFKTYIRNFDYTVFFAYVILLLFGLVMVYSASMMVAIEDDKQAPDFYFQNQKFNIFVGFMAFLIGAIFPYRHFSRPGLMKFLTGVMIVLIAWLWVSGIGTTQTGSNSWINVFGITTFQPSEYIKLFVILYLSATIYNKGKKGVAIKQVTPVDISFPIAIWIIAIASVAMETDLGAGVIIGFIAMAILVLSGIPGKTLFKFISILAGFGAIILFAVFLIKGDSLLTESRLGRFQVMGNPFEYAQGSGYQIINGYLAIGAGGLEGVGLGQSIQKLGFLPEPQTDFIMAIIAEELGIKGVAIVLIGLGIIVARSLIIAMTTKDPLARMIAGGIGAWIGIQTFVNLGGITGLIPLTGVTLPFISYGGSSIMLLSVALGILMNISMFHKREKRKITQ